MSIWKRLRFWLPVSTPATGPQTVEPGDVAGNREMALHEEAEPNPEARKRILERHARSQRNARYRSGPWQQK